jgi:cob(I)alamin adenosyltransferase
MDGMDKELAPCGISSCPGGMAISQAHICRTVCRRAERRVVRLATEQEIPEICVRYLNRLSDLLFVVARHLHHTLDVPETRWPKDR